MLNQFPRLHDRDIVTNFKRFIQVVTYEQNCLVQLLLKKNLRFVEEASSVRLASLEVIEEAS